MEKDTSFFLTTFENRQFKGTSSYKYFEWEIQNNGFSLVQIGNKKAKIYNPALVFFFTSEELPVLNRETKKETTINGSEYLTTYIDAYIEGEQYFETEFKLSPNTLYGQNTKQYVKDIHLHYFHTNHTHTVEGWSSVKTKTPLILTHQTIKELGYYSGIVNKVEEQIKKYPQLFATFNKCEHHLTSKPIEKQKPELNGKLITLKNRITIEKIHSELKGYFPNKEAELLKALQGEQLDEKLLFQHNGSSFIEVFKRLKYNGYLISTPTEIKDWICENFIFLKTQGIKKTVEDFKGNTVWDVLTKTKCEPSKKNRICEPEWLPFIPQKTRQRQTENEKL